MALSPDGRTLATGSQDNTARLWDTRSGKPLAPPFLHEGSITSIAFSPDGRTLATGAEDNTARLWDIRSRKPLAPPLQHQGIVNAIAFSPDGRSLATGGWDGTAWLWDTRSGKQLMPPLQHQSSVDSVAFSPDGRTLATGTARSAQIWDTRSGKPVAPLFQHQSIFLNAMAFSPDGQTLATKSSSFSGDSTIRFWGTRSGKPFAPTSNLQGFFLAMAFHPNGKVFIVARQHWLNTYLWDGKKAKPQNSQLLYGSWIGGFHAPADCERCLQVVLEGTGNSFHLETLSLDQSNDPPIGGDPKDLLKKWQERLRLTFDEEMRPVPR